MKMFSWFFKGVKKIPQKLWAKFKWGRYLAEEKKYLTTRDNKSTYDVISIKPDFQAAFDRRVKNPCFYFSRHGSKIFFFMTFSFFSQFLIIVSWEFSIFYLIYPYLLLQMTFSLILHLFKKIPWNFGL